jgi:regulatory protein
MNIISIRKIRRDAQIIFETGEEQLIRYEVFIKSGLRKNDSVDEEIIHSLEKENKKYLAKEKAYNILARRNHSTKELERKLIQRKFERGIIKEIIDELVNLNFLDDERFAREYLEEKLRFKNVGLEKIKNELFYKGVPREIIKNIIEEKTDIDETESALQLAEKKIKSILKKVTDRRIIRQKIYSFLLSKGYKYETIENVINKIKPEMESE